MIVATEYMEETERCGVRIRQLREQQGISVRDLAKRMQIKHQALSQIELGRGNPTLGTLVKIAKALGVKTRDLITDEDGQALFFARDTVMIAKSQLFDWRLDDQAIEACLAELRQKLLARVTEYETLGVMN